MGERAKIDVAGDDLLKFHVFPGYLQDIPIAPADFTWSTNVVFTSGAILAFGYNCVCNAALDQQGCGL